MRAAVAKFNESVTAPENIILLIDKYLNPNIPKAEVVKDNHFIEMEASDGRVNDILVANKSVLKKIFDIYAE
jgi:hypothetical protein